MSDSETEHPSSPSEGFRESEPSPHKGKQRAKKKMKMMSSSSEDEEEEEEEELQQRATTSGASAAEMSEDEEEGAVGPIYDKTAHDNVLTEEGDDDGDSGDTDSSSEVPGAETCAICLGRMRGEVGSPESCEHTFCLICILEWAKTNASCPQDRKAFTKVLVRMTLSTEEVDREVVIKKQESELVVTPETDNPTYCEVCHECDREERLLLCDGCDLGFHLECLDPPLDQVPLEEWFCPGCASNNLPSTVMTQQTPDGESSTSRGRPRRQPSSSQRPRLIPRTRATERVRDRIIRKRKEKRKKRRLSRKRKIDSGEIDDTRPVDYKDRLMYFGSINDEVPAEDANDTFADQLLAGVSEWPSSRNSMNRKVDAVKALRDAAFTPSTSYSGKASMAVINRVNIQSEEAREDDVLSGILEKQSIVLTNTKKLSLTSDRKLKKEGEAPVSDAESFSLKQEGSSLMTEPLPSRRSTQKDEEGRDISQEDDRRHFSPSRGSSHSRFSRHSSYSHNSRYGHSSRGFEFNRRPQREERVFREERMQRDERLSGSVHQSPLEVRRRSPPRMSYQRQIPSHQFRNQRNAPSDNRNREPRTRWNERQRYQRSPPQKDSGYRQNPSSETRWGRRQTESSGSSSREPSSQERYGRNGRDNSKENSDHRSFKRGSSPPSSVHDKSSRRSEDDDKYSRREEDRRRKEDRGYHRQHYQRDNSQHRGYKSYRTEKESPSSHSSRRSRSCSRSPVRSKSPIRSRSPARSRSRSRLKETYIRDHDDAKRKRKAHKYSNNNGESVHRSSISPMPPEGTLDDSQQHGDDKVTSGNDSDSDANPSPHLSQVHEPSGEPSSETPDSTAEKDKFMEAKSRTSKNEMHEEKFAFAKGSLKVPREVKREREDIKDDNDTCNSDVVDQKPVPGEVNIRKAEIRIDKEGKGSEFGVGTEDDLLNDAKSINFSVQSSCKEDRKRDKLHEDTESAHSRKNGSESDTRSLQSVDCVEDTNKEEQQSENETTFKAESQPERKKRKKFISGFFGRVLEYTPEVELSHWDEESCADVSSPFKVIKKSDANESDRGISLPFSLQRFLPGERNIVRESDDRKKTPKDGKLKHKSDSDSRHEEEKTLEMQKNEGHETQKSERIHTGNIKKEDENVSEDKSHKKKGHKAPKVDTKPPTNKAKDSVSPSSSHTTIPRSKSKERSTDKATMKESKPQPPLGKESSAHSNIKRERTQSSSQACDHSTIKNHEHSLKKEPAEKVIGLQGIFGDISDLSDTVSDDDDEIDKKMIKGSPVVGKSPLKQKDTEDIKHKPMHDKAKDRGRKSEHESRILKGDELPTKSLKLEDSVASCVTSSSQKEESKSKNQGRGTKHAKPNKGHVLDLFGNTSDSDDADNIGIKVEETRLQKSPEKLLKSSPFKVDSVHRKEREGTDSHKVKDRKSEKETSPHRKSSEEPSKSSSESHKHDSLHKKGREATEKHKGKDRKSEKESSPHRKSSEEPSKSSSESLFHKKGREATDSHKGKDRKSEKETSPHRKSSEETPKGYSVSRKEKEGTDSHKKKDKKSEKEMSPHKKSSEETPKSSTESCKDDSVQRKGGEATDIHRGKDRMSEKEISPHRKSSEEPSKSSSESSDDDYISWKEKQATDSDKEKDIKSEKETSPHKSSEEPSKSFSELLGFGSRHRKAREPTDTHKRKDKKSERESSPYKKSSEEPSKSSSESSKHDSVHRKEKEVTDTHKRKDRKSEKKTSPRQKSIEEPSKVDSDLGKIKETTNSHEEQEDTCQQEKQKKLSEKPLKAEQPKYDTDSDKIREATNNHEGQKGGCSQETQKKISERPGKSAASEHHDNQADHKKATEVTTDIPKGQPQKDKRFAQTPTEDHSRRKAGCSLDGDGDTHNIKKRKSCSNPEGRKHREKDPVNKAENKPLVAATSSLQSTSHPSDRREKKDANDPYAKQLKASLELKVVTEVKRWLDPHYRDKSITKEEYKEIVAKCVSKVVSAECGDVIESEKMHILVEGYVKLYKHRRAKQHPPPSS